MNENDLPMVSEAVKHMNKSGIKVITPNLFSRMGACVIIRLCDCGNPGVFWAWGMTDAPRHMTKD